MEKNGMAYYMKALLFLHLGWAFLSTTSLRDEKHAWGRMKHWAHTGTATSIMQFKGLTTITSFHEGWSYTLNHPMGSQQEHQGTVDIQPSRTIHLSSSKLTLPWQVKVRVTYEGVTLFQVRLSAENWNYIIYNIFGRSITKTFWHKHVFVKRLHWNYHRNFQYEQLELEKQFAILKFS